MKRLLLIDDDAGIRGALRLLLEKSGFAVVEAGDGREGLQRFRQLRPDLVLCDVFMPERDGLETIRELARAFPGVKIIAMSGGGFGGRLDLLSLAKEFGALATLRKPFPLAEALRAVHHALGDTPASDPGPETSDLPVPRH